MSIIEVKNLTYSYIGSIDNVFENENFILDSNWKLGLIGRNGYGKTTLLNILMGNLKYQGSINTNLEFDYFPYDIKDENNLTLYAIEEIKGDIELWKLEKELNLLSMDIEVLYRPYNSLSRGEQTKVLLATLFISENKFLLIDEPTNNLDILGREQVSNYLNSKSGYIVVSHDRNFLDNTVDHILALEKNKINIISGNYSTWKENKNLEDNFEIAENQKLRKEIKRLKQASREKSNWSDKVESSKKGSREKLDKGFIGHKSAKMMKLSKNLEKRHNEIIEDKQKLLKNIDSIEKLDIEPISHHQNNYITVENLSVYYDNRKIFKEIEFVLNNGDVLVLEGKNGSGKTSLINLLLGCEISYKGEIKLANNLKISYLPQNFDYLEGFLDDFIIENNIDKTKFFTILRKLGFSRNQFLLPMENYSSGQRKKVLIAKSLCEEAHIYIWDEPLNYLDLISRIQLENMILVYSPTMIIVEHDKVFVDKIATDIVKLVRV